MRWDARQARRGLAVLQVVIGLRVDFERRVPVIRQDARFPGKETVVTTSARFVAVSRSGCRSLDVRLLPAWRGRSQTNARGQKTTYTYTSCRVREPREPRGTTTWNWVLRRAVATSATWPGLGSGFQ